MCEVKDYKDYKYYIINITKVLIYYRMYYN
jgi:hypothetical protein